MTTVAMPKDANKNPIPVLSFSRGSGAHKISVTSTSARTSTAFTSSVISVYSTQDCYIELGGSSVTATTSSHFIPLGTYIDIDLSDGSGPATHLAAIRDSADGTLYISERV